MYFLFYKDYFFYVDEVVYFITVYNILTEVEEVKY